MKQIDSSRKNLSLTTTRSLLKQKELMVSLNPFFLDVILTLYSVRDLKERSTMTIQSSYEKDIIQLPPSDFCFASLARYFVFQNFPCRMCG
ncbi:MAG: hypothetical protein AB1630_09450 [bacterium]